MRCINLDIPTVEFILCFKARVYYFQNNMESKSKEIESDNEGNSENYEPDIHFEPVVSLPLIAHVTLEEDETTLLKL